MKPGETLEPGWSHRWRNHLTDIGVIDQTTLRAGDAYRRNDDQLDVVVAPGRLASVAGAGRRISYEVNITVDLLPPDDRAALWQAWASQPAVAAAVLGGRLPAALTLSGEPGAGLLPRALQIRWTCPCAQLGVLDQDGPCRHVAAVLDQFGHHLEREPHDLLLLRGARPSEVTDALGPASADDPEDDRDPAAAWSAPVADLPPRLARPDAPGRRPPFASDPPASAPFSAEGLRSLSDRAADRAWQALGRPDSTSSLGYGDDAETDLVRMAVEATDNPARRRLAEVAGITLQELAARSRAWTVAGRPGIDVQREHLDRRRVDDSTELRQGPDRRWYRFVKERGRWWLHGVADDDPSDGVSIADPHR